MDRIMYSAQAAVNWIVWQIGALWDALTDFAFNMGYEEFVWLALILGVVIVFVGARGSTLR